MKVEPVFGVDYTANRGGLGLERIVDEARHAEILHQPATEGLRIALPCH